MKTETIGIILAVLALFAHVIHIIVDYIHALEPDQTARWPKIKRAFWTIGLGLIGALGAVYIGWIFREKTFMERYKQLKQLEKISSRIESIETGLSRIGKTVSNQGRQMTRNNSKLLQIVEGLKRRFPPPPSSATIPMASMFRIQRRPLGLCHLKWSQQHENSGEPLATASLELGVGIGDYVQAQLVDPTGKAVGEVMQAKVVAVGPKQTGEPTLTIPRRYFRLVANPELGTVNAKVWSLIVYPPEGFGDVEARSSDSEK